MFTMSGRADYGDATTVALIDELADLMDKAEMLDAVITRRLKPHQRASYEAAWPIKYLDTAKLRQYATDWQARLDAAEKIVTEFVHPPIPVRNMDWSAVRGNYDPENSDHVGYGATEDEAIADLLALEEEAAE